MNAIRKLLRFAGFSAGMMLCCRSFSALGATSIVTATGSFAFSPATLTINAGDSVTWNGLGLHTSTSGTVAGSTETPDGLWSSSANGFTHTFPDAGTFPYYCIPHGVSFGMKGTIIVNASANVPPTVAITSPANGITLSAPASLTLVANAADSDGSVTNVQFLQGATSLGNAATAPFSISVSNLAAADYTFSTIASDNGGATATNAITVHVINPSPLTITAPAVSPPNHFQFSYASDIGLSYVVEISTNLSSGWNPRVTNIATANPTVFTDPNAGGGGAFYRVGRQPNP